MFLSLRYVFLVTPTCLMGLPMFLPTYILFVAEQRCIFFPSLSDFQVGLCVHTPRCIDKSVQAMKYDDTYLPFISLRGASTDAAELALVIAAAAVEAGVGSGASGETLCEEAYAG